MRTEFEEITMMEPSSLPGPIIGAFEELIQKHKFDLEMWVEEYDDLAVVDIKFEKKG